MYGSLVWGTRGPADGAHQMKIEAALEMIKTITPGTYELCGTTPRPAAATAGVGSMRTSSLFQIALHWLATRQNLFGI